MMNGLMVWCLCLFVCESDDNRDETKQKMRGN